MRRVHEAARAGVDADVIDAVPAHAEEHQVPGQQLRERHRLRGALLRGRGARDAQADALVHVERKPAAVKAALVRAAERVRRADERGAAAAIAAPWSRRFAALRGKATCRRRRAGAKCCRRSPAATARG